MIDRDKSTDTIDQLWYGWSSAGLDRVRVGFRIRAASEGLRDVNSQRMQALGRYQRYMLPQKAEVMIPVKEAPICLAYAEVGGERILVHKAYTGKDEVGRYGAFFVHLLAKLPETFSALQAILLWRSSFWQVSDKTLPPDDTRLPQISSSYLEKMQNDTLRKLLMRGEVAKKVQEYLPHVIKAYLTKKPIIDAETRERIPQKIYIAAPDHEIALLILGLVSCLPMRIRRSLTFSTYEHDVSEASTEIVGTCWLSQIDAAKNPQVAKLLPASYYQEKLAINLYTGECFRPTDNPLLENKPHINEFIGDAMKYVTRKCTREFAKKFQMLLDMASDADIEEFLELYTVLIIQGEESLKAVLFSSEHLYIAKMLSRPLYQRALVNLAVSDANWWIEGFPVLVALGTASRRIPALEQALAATAQMAIHKVVALINENNTHKNAGVLKAFILLIKCIAPPDVNQAAWVNLLKKLSGTQNILPFFRGHWDIYADLMRTWAIVLPASPKSLKMIRLFLCWISWVEFGDFIDLLLPLDWIEEGIKALIASRTSGLSEEICHSLQHDYHSQLENLLHQLAQERRRWPITQQLFIRIVEGNYARKLELLLTLLDSPMGKGNLEKLLKFSHLTSGESEEFLLHYGEHYLAQYRQSRLLIRYVQEYLGALPTTEIDIFLRPPAPKQPSPTEKFLLFLQNSGISYISLETLAHWCLVARFVRQPSWIWQQREEVAVSIGYILTLPQLSDEMYAQLIEHLAKTCIADHEGVLGMIATMYESLRTRDLMALFDGIAKSARYNIARGNHASALLLTCIRLASTFRGRFQAKGEQEYFIESFFDTLLHPIGWVNLIQSSSQIEALTVEDQAIWKQYLVRRPGLQAIVEATPAERIKLWWERTVAFNQVQWTLFNGNPRNIARASIDYMTTLINYEGERIDRWWTSINQAVADVSNQKERLQQTPESIASYVGLKPIKIWWERISVLTRIGRALRGKRIGRIVREVSNHSFYLESDRVSLPESWWKQIEVSCDFYVACKEASEKTDKVREEAIVEANKSINALMHTGYPAPKLTLHEKMRKNAALYYRDDYRYGLLKHWEPQTLLPPSKQTGTSDSSKK